MHLQGLDEEVEMREKMILHFKENEMSFKIRIFGH